MQLISDIAAVMYFLKAGPYYDMITTGDSFNTLISLRVRVCLRVCVHVCARPRMFNLFTDWPELCFPDPIFCSVWRMEGEREDPLRTAFLSQGATMELNQNIKGLLIV